MKATGIVRRIDDLGRVVIPKEIRRTLRIREGDPLEIFVKREGEVILKKYSPISELGDFATEYAEAIFDTLQLPTFICDRDEVIAVSGQSKKEYLSRRIGTDIEQAIEKRQHLLSTEQTELEIIHNITEEINGYVISPVIANGDSIGVVLIIAKDDQTLTEVEAKVALAAANFLGKQME